MCQACWKEGEENSGQLQRSPVSVRNSFSLLEKEETAMQRACRGPIAAHQESLILLLVPKQRMYEK